MFVEEIRLWGDCSRNKQMSNFPEKIQGVLWVTTDPAVGFCPLRWSSRLQRKWVCKTDAASAAPDPPAQRKESLPSSLYLDHCCVSLLYLSLCQQIKGCGKDACFTSRSESGSRLCSWYLTCWTAAFVIRAPNTAWKPLCCGYSSPCGGKRTRLSLCNGACHHTRSGSSGLTGPFGQSSPLWWCSARASNGVLHTNLHHRGLQTFCKESQILWGVNVWGPNIWPQVYNELFDENVSAMGYFWALHINQKWF